MTTPYKVGYSEKHDIYWVEDNNGETVCDLYHKINEVKFYRKSNAKNNAHLFAAAPEMKKALQAVRCDSITLHNGTITPETLAMVIDALENCDPS